MEITREEYMFHSTTGTCDIHAHAYMPVDTSAVRAVLQIVHGMAEHSERYHDLAVFMAEHGYAVYIHDQAGHGRSVSGENELGYFGAENGWENLVRDVHILTGKAAQTHANRPVFLLGHSMGSFVARAYVTRYAGALSGAIFSGTSGPNPGAAAGIAIAKMTEKFKGDHFRSAFINHIAFGSYNKKYGNVRTEFDWLSRDTQQVDKYIADPLCGFLFTAAGYRDMFSLLNSVSGKKWYARVQKSLPMLFISGSMDPVGGYGKGVRQVARTLKDTGHKNVSLRLYPDARHELFNETNAADVREDLLKWTESVRKNNG